MNRAIIICIVSLVFLSCYRLIPYNPNPARIDNPVETIQQVLTRQTDSPTPAEIVVTNERIKIVTIWTGAESLTSDIRYGPVYSYIYFNAIGSVKLYKKISYVVFVIDKNGQKMYTVVYRSEEDAKIFIDSLYALVDKLP